MRHEPRNKLLMLIAEEELQFSLDKKDWLENVALFCKSSRA